MYDTILLAAALQKWERYSAHALAARDLALALAKVAANPLHVLSAYDYEYIPPTDVPPEMQARLQEEHRFRTDDLMRQKIDEYVAPLKTAGIAFKSMLEVGNARQIIVQVASEIGADLLVIGSHSKRGLLDIVLGGTAQQIIKHAPCQVALVSPKN